jgi:hypothetical protein
MVLLLAHLSLKCVSIISAALSWVGISGVGGVLCEGLRGSILNKRRQPCKGNVG